MPIEFSPEGSGFSRGVENKIDRERVVKPAHEKAGRYMRDNKFKEKDFEDIYTKERVAKDLETVERIKEALSREEDEKIIEANKLSEIFNAMIIDQIGLNDWMGVNANINGTSDFDRFTTSLSNVTEFKGDSGISYLAMAMRVTFSPFNVDKKLSAIKESIKTEKFPTIKYFNSQFHRGELKELPTAVVGCRKGMMLEAAELWLLGKKRELAEHPLQFFILDQIKEQMEVFKKYALSLKQENIAERYDMVLSIIDNILESKKELRDRLENQKDGDGLEVLEENDPVMTSLRLELKSLFRKEKSPSVG